MNMCFICTHSGERLARIFHEGKGLATPADLSSCARDLRVGMCFICKHSGWSLT